VTVDIVVKKLRENISERTEEKSNLIKYLEEYQKSIPSLHLLSDVLKTSFGAIPRERGKTAALFYLKRLKDE